jgi:cytochrome c oxidase assembly factor CtaG
VSALLRGENWPIEWPLAGIVVAATLYALGGRPRESMRRAVSYYAGLLVVVLAVDSPIDAYADRLFWVHMVQHVLLTMVAPPLLLLGRPWPRIIRPLPLRLRRVIARTLLLGRPLAAPLPAFVLFNGVLLAWHVPALFDLTLRNSLVHDTEHALFLSTALLFWTHLAPTSRRPRLSELQRVAYGIGAILVSWALAVALGFASHPLYAHYAALAHRPGGLSALADQQLAAGIMWVPASVPFTIAVFIAAYRFIEPGRERPVMSDLRPRETT